MADRPVLLLRAISHAISMNAQLIALSLIGLTMEHALSLAVVARCSRGDTLRRKLLSVVPHAQLA